jgi:hypothetical protein
MTNKGRILAASAFGFLAALGNHALAGNDKDGAKQVVCDGINACKGQGSCAGPHNACGGQNGCKGQGHTKTTEKDCLAKGGKVMADKADKGDKDAKDAKGKM